MDFQRAKLRLFRGIAKERREFLFKKVVIRRVFNAGGPKIVANGTLDRHFPPLVARVVVEVQFFANVVLDGELNGDALTDILGICRRC